MAVARPLSFLESALERGLLPEEALPSSLVIYLREVLRLDESSLLIVFRTDRDGMRSIQNIERYKDGDPETITRPRGGIVHALLNERREYRENKHFLLPIKNNQGRMRFMYKSNIGQSILQNLAVQKAKY